MSKSYLVPVVYSMYGRVEIEADSPDEAIRKAEERKSELPLPDQAFYLEDSYEVDTEGIVMDEDGNICD